MAEYAETAALVAVMEGDREELDRLLNDFHPVELSDLASHCSRLEKECYRVRSAKERGDG